MQENIPAGIQTTTDRVKPQYLTFLTMLYVTFSVIGCAVLYKIVKIDFVVGPGGIISLPFVLLLEDIIAEVYGYRISRALLWQTMIAQLLFTGFVIAIINMPSPIYWHGEIDYQAVFGLLSKGVPTMVVAIFCGRFLNLYIITKMKIWVRGRHFWMRSIFSSFIGDIVTLSILYPISFSALPFHEWGQLYMSDLFTRVLYSIIGGGPAVLLVRYLKRKEGIDIYDYHTNFNPFKMGLKD
jgi:uncharacterized integral membrane protein (TIGR00697 family)